MLARRFSSFAILAMLILVGCTEPAQQVDVVEETVSPVSEATVFSNFTLIDGNGGEAVSAAAMIVEDGAITWIGTQSQLQVPEGAEVVDLVGKFVMPGLMDLHVHLSVLENFTFNHEVFTRENVEDELRTYASYGVTTVMAQGTDKDLIFDLIREQRSGLPNVARVYTAGQGIVYQNGYGGVVGINDPVSTVDEVIRAVQEQSRKGVDVIKLWVDDEFGTMPLMPAEISEAAIATAHAENLRVVAHIFKLEDAKKLAAQGVDGFVHGVRDQEIDQELLDLMLENELWQVSSTLSREAAMFAYAQRAPFLDDPFFTRSVPESILQRLASPAHHESVISGPHYSQFPGILANSMSNLKHVADAGVRFAFGTDSGPPGRFPGYAAHWELELMVESGLSPMQAIQAATAYAAEFLGADHLGTLQLNKAADFIVLNANPLVDITNTRSIESVYVAGNEVN